MNSEKFYNIHGVKVFWADYKYWKKCIGGKNEKVSAKSVDQMLCRHFGYISASHIISNTLHECPKLSGTATTAQRPNMYRRSSTKFIEGVKYDVKGTGLPPGEEPTLEEYMTGLFGLPNACVEALAERMVRKALRHSEIATTTKTLAILSLPISTKLHKSSKVSMPNAILVRKSVSRPVAGDIFPKGSEMINLLLELELRLRAFGLTSCASGNNFKARKENGNLYINKKKSGKEICINLEDGNSLSNFNEIDMVNIQLGFDDDVEKLCLLDFEHYSRKGDFFLPLGILSKAQSEWCFEILDTSDDDFVAQPSKKLVGYDLLESRNLSVSSERIFGKKIYLQIIDRFSKSGLGAAQSYFLRAIRPMR